MSQGNVEIVERIYAAARTPLPFEFYAADIEWDMTNYVGWTDDPVYHGHEGVRKMMSGWIASFDRWEPTLERAIPFGDDVIAVVDDRAFVKGGAKPMVRRYAQRFTFRSAVIIRTRLYSDVAAALKAVGLSG